MTVDKKYEYSILFVEDEVILRENYVLYLKMMFETVYEAGDGEEAYNIYKKNKIDILIVDINIPKLNGLELLEKIREHDHSSKAIVLTAHKEKDFLLQATRLKLTDYLLKPISRLALQTAIDKAIDELRNFSTITIKNKVLSDNYIWNYSNEELTCKDKTIHLTNKEKIVFSLFMNNINVTLSKDQFIYTIWDEYEECHEASLKTILAKLRKKLPSGMISNIHGIGYKIAT